MIFITYRTNTLVWDNLWNCIPLSERLITYLAAINDIIQTHIYNRNRNLFNYEFDVVFYDVTTFYFQSAVQENEAMRQIGFDNEGKIGKTQILFLLLMIKIKCPEDLKSLEEAIMRVILLRTP